MCDYSWASSRFRLARMGDVLIVLPLGRQALRGFVDAQDVSMAVCLASGTELAFQSPISFEATPLPAAPRLATYPDRMATFYECDGPWAGRGSDVLELPGGERIGVQKLEFGQGARIVQLPPAMTAVRRGHERRDFNLGLEPARLSSSA